MDELMDYERAVAEFDPVLGIEVHVELGTATKMFDAAPNAFGGDPNTYVTPVSLGLPGSLPVVNHKAVEYAIKIGLALGCDIAQGYLFSRPIEADALNAVLSASVVLEGFAPGSIGWADLPMR